MASVILAGALLSLGAQAGCGLSPRQEDDGAPRLVVLLDAMPRSLDPRFALDATSMRLSRLVFAALVSVDNDELAPVPELAERVYVDPGDERTWHVNVRQGLRFHDGTPLTGADVVYTFRSVLDPATGSPYRGEYESRLASVELDAADPYHVVFRLFQPLATFRTDLVLGIVPEHLLASAPEGRFAPGHYVGAGPFRFAGQPHPARIELERASASPTPGAVQRLVFKVVRDENARLLSLLAGSSDLVQNSVTPTLVDTLAQEPALEVVSAPSISLTYVGLNLRAPALADRRVREALAAALDREALVRHRFGGRAVLANGLFAPMHWAHVPDVALPAYDPARAEALLDEAGYPREPESGMRLTLELKLSTNRFRMGLAQLLAHQWEAIGVRVRTRAFEFSTFFADVKEGRFDAFLLQLPEPVEPDMLRWMFEGLATPVHTPHRDAESAYARLDRRAFAPGALALLDDPRCGDWAKSALVGGIARLAEHASGLAPTVGQGNRTFMASPQLDCLLARGRREMDPAARYAIYAEAQRLLARELPILPLWHEDHVAIFRRGIKGFRLIPNGRFAPLADVLVGSAERTFRTDH